MLNFPLETTITMEHIEKTKLQVEELVKGNIEDHLRKLPRMTDPTAKTLLEIGYLMSVCTTIIPKSVLMLADIVLCRLEVFRVG